MVHSAVMLLAQCAVSGKDVSVNCTCVLTYALSSRCHKMVGEIFFCIPGSSGTVCLFIIIFALNHNVEF